MVDLIYWVEEEKLSLTPYWPQYYIFPSDCFLGYHLCLVCISQILSSNGKFLLLWKPLLDVEYWYGSILSNNDTTDTCTLMVHLDFGLGEGGLGGYWTGQGCDGRAEQFIYLNVSPKEFFKWDWHHQYPMLPSWPWYMPWVHLDIQLPKCWSKSKLAYWEPWYSGIYKQKIVYLFVALWLAHNIQWSKHLHHWSKIEFGSGLVIISIFQRGNWGMVASLKETHKKL